VCTSPSAAHPSALRTLLSLSPPPSRTLPSLPLSLSPSLSLSSSLPPSPSPPPSSPSLFDSTWGCVCVGLACALMNAGALPALRRLSAWTGLVRAGRKRKNENTRRGILCRMFLLSFPPSPFPLSPLPPFPGNYSRAARRRDFHGRVRAGRLRAGWFHRLADGAASLPRNRGETCGNDDDSVNFVWHVDAQRRRLIIVLRYARLSAGIKHDV